MIFNHHLPTLLDTTRICNLIQYANRANGLDAGATFAEFGTYRGGSGEILAKTCPNRALYLIDSFQGLPSANSEKDFHVEGEFAEVDHLGLVGYFKMMYNNVKVLKGFSPKVFEFFGPEHKFAFVFVDVDLYQSVLDACEFFFPRMCAGGIILFDDYGYRGTRGAKEAVDEFLSNPFIDISYHGELKQADGGFVGQYILIKK